MKQQFAPSREGEDPGNPALTRARAEHRLEQQLEALLLVADEPVSAVSLATAVDRPVREVRRALEALQADYDGGGNDGVDGEGADGNGAGYDGADYDDTGYDGVDGEGADDNSAGYDSVDFDGTGSEGTGTDGKGSEGTGSERTDNAGAGKDRTGSKGTGNEGAGRTPQRGFELREVAGGYRFYVRESLDPLVADFVQQQSPSRLSQAALETLAVVAYRQPVSRGAIASVRAVNVDSVVRTLVGRGLITEVGHDAETGAILYGTDETLLGHLGISSLDELPPIAPLLDDPDSIDDGFDQ